MHSPFMYAFTDGCLRIALDVEDSRKLNAVYKGFLNSKATIQIQDFGAGSKRLGNTRSIQQIAKTSSSNGKYGQLLYRLSRSYKPERILEFGTSLGIGTHHLHLGNPGAEITTVEACSNTFNAAKARLPESVKALNMTFDEFLRSEVEGVYHLIFIDGHHDGKALIDYVNRLLPYSDDETVFVLDDIRWSDSMFEAWKQLSEDERFHVSIDLFRVGIILRRPTQRKEMFVTRY